MAISKPIALDETLQAVNTTLQGVKTALENQAGSGSSVDIVTSWQSTPDNSHVPSEKLVKDNLDLKANQSTTYTKTEVDTKFDDFEDNVAVIIQNELKKTTTWGKVQANVQAGKGSAVYPIGTKFAIYKAPNATTKGTLAKYYLDVVAHNKHFKKDSSGNNTATYSMTLQIHELLTDTMQFDAKESQYGLSLDTSVVSWKTYYSNTSGTTVSSPSGSPKDKGYYEKNHSDRVSYGNNCWRTSGLRQWLNADPSKSAGGWWTKQHACDVAPAYSSYLPFQALLAEDADGNEAGLLDVIGEVSIDTILSTVKRPDASSYYLDCDANGDYSSSRLTYDRTEDKFFLPSTKEVYASSYTEPNGVILDYYEDNSSLSSASDSADTNRVKMQQNSSSATYWWLRSAHSGSSYYVCGVSSSGNRDGSSAYHTTGVSPLCVIY